MEIIGHPRTPEEMNGDSRKSKDMKRHQQRQQQKQQNEIQRNQKRLAGTCRLVLECSF